LRPNSSARLCREQDQGFEGAGALRFAEDQVAVAAGDIGVKWVWPRSSTVTRPGGERSK